VSMIRRYIVNIYVLHPFPFLAFPCPLKVKMWYDSLESLTVVQLVLTGLEQHELAGAAFVVNTCENHAVVGPTPICPVIMVPFFVFAGPRGVVGGCTGFGFATGPAQHPCQTRSIQVLTLTRLSTAHIP
jgi:hypothetical protein